MNQEEIILPRNLADISRRHKRLTKEIEVISNKLATDKQKVITLTRKLQNINTAIDTISDDIAYNTSPNPPSVPNLEGQSKRNLVNLARRFRILRRNQIQVDKVVEETLKNDRELNRRYQALQVCILRVTEDLALIVSNVFSD